MVEPLLLVGLAIGLVVAGFIDVQEGRIPNWLTFSLAGFGMVVHTWQHGWTGMLISVEGLAMGLLCLLFFYIKGGMGAGDVKLLGAIGAIVGPKAVVYVFAFAALLGGVYSIAMLCSQGGLGYVGMRLRFILSKLKLGDSVSSLNAVPVKEPKLRYALVIGLGTMVAQTLLLYGLL